MLDIIIFTAYIGLVLGIGRYWSKRVHSTEDFHLCGRQLGAIYPLFVAPLASLAVMIPAAVFSKRQ